MVRNRFQSRHKKTFNQSHIKDGQQREPGATVKMTNSATVEAIREDGKIVVQTPIITVQHANILVDGDEAQTVIDTVMVANNARIERIKGYGNVVVQMPIFIFDSIDIEQLINYEKQIKSTVMTNSANIGKIEGKGNLIIQIPILLMDDNSLDEQVIGSFPNKVKNLAEIKMVGGEGNVIIQTSVVVNVQDLVSGSFDSTLVI